MNLDPVLCFKPLQGNKGTGVLHSWCPLPSPGDQRWVIWLYTCDLDLILFKTGWIAIAFHFNLPTCSTSGISKDLPSFWLLPCCAEHHVNISCKWCSVLFLPLCAVLQPWVNAKIVSPLFALANSWFETVPAQGFFYYLFSAFLCLKSGLAYDHIKRLQCFSPNK